MPETVTITKPVPPGPPNFTKDNEPKANVQIMATLSAKPANVTISICKEDDGSAPPVTDSFSTSADVDKTYSVSWTGLSLVAVTATHTGTPNQGSDNEGTEFNVTATFAPDSLVEVASEGGSKSSANVQVNVNVNVG
jgi:hypothetical protein